MATWKLSPEGLQRCIEAGRQRMASLTPDERAQMASRNGTATLLRYSSEYYRSLGKKSAEARPKTA